MKIGFVTFGGKVCREIKSSRVYGHRCCGQVGARAGLKVQGFFCCYEKVFAVDMLGDHGKTPGRTTPSAEQRGISGGFSPRACVILAVIHFLSLVGLLSIY